MQRREQLLGDILEFYDHMRVPLSSLERDTRQGEYRYYGAQGVIDHIDNFIYDGQFVLIAEDGANLVTRNDPIAFLVEGQFWVNNHAHVVKGKEGVADDYYVTRLLNSMNIAGFITGAAQPKLSQQNLKQIKVELPPYDAQRRIADILSAYDDLIENNRRRVTLLEETAGQLYREWFVRLRFPGHEHTRITNGVPEGWEKRTFGEACSSLEDGDWIEMKNQGGDDYRLLQISNIGVNEFVETGNYRYVTEETFKRLNCRELLPGHILIARMPKPIGRAWLVTEMPWRMITAVDAAIAIANDELADAYFLTHYLNSPASLEHCERRAVGATRPRIARRELVALPLLLPPRRLQAHFREVAEPLNQQRAVLYRQNEKLRTARDLLLPRLMTGQVAV